MTILRFGNLDIRGKRVLIREDLNVPVDNGKVTSDARIRAALPTLEYAVKQGAKVMVMSHLGRPQEGLSIDQQPELSLEPVASRISELSGLTVRLETNYLEGFLSVMKTSFCLKIFASMLVKKVTMKASPKNWRR